MCYDRLTDEETVESSLPAVLGAEWRCALRNGAMAAAIVLAVLLVQSAPPWLVAVSAAGAVALGALLHQAVMAAGWGVLRARARWRAGRGETAA